MLGLLVLAFLVVPLVELFVLIQVGGAIGALNTVGLLFLVSVVGGWLMKQQGLGVVRRVQASLAAGRVPGAEVVDGFLIVLGGALMLTPGFFTDALGLALLLPPVRTAVRAVVRRRLVARVTGGAGPSGVIDL
jgi:UPF0716 protein FxsA